MPTSRQPSKPRAVFKDRNGFYHIMGLFDPELHELKDFIDLGPVGFSAKAKLLQVSPRMVLYVEI